MAAFQRLAHDINVADAFKAVIDTTAGHLNQMIHDILDFAWVDEISHTKMFTQLRFLRVEIDTNNTGRANHARALNDIQANASQAKHGDRRARLNLHGEGNRANAGCDAAADIANLIEGCILAYLGDSYFGQYREVRKG